MLMLYCYVKTVGGNIIYTISYVKQKHAWKKNWKETNVKMLRVTSGQ